MFSSLLRKRLACGRIEYCSACYILYRDSIRSYHLPGWKTKVCTKDARTRQQREEDRKVRQLEKLPPVEALHDFQYPYEKTILSDYMFQYPLFENELDTPHLFHLTPPPNFFLYWNVSDFERTNYPSVPQEDHRLLLPSSTCKKWEEHRIRSLRYLEKHQIIPNFFTHVDLKVNLSVVFSKTSSSRSCSSVHQAKKKALVSPTGCSSGFTPPTNRLTRRNFWFTAHCGNYIELKELQHPPTLFLNNYLSGSYCKEKTANFPRCGGSVQKSADVPLTAAVTNDSHQYYTFLMVSPDYPYRLPSYEDKREKRGFFLHYMVANLSSPELQKDVFSPSSLPPSAQKEKRMPLFPSQLHNWVGDVVVPYAPPLPTEDAGTTRHLCVLYRQREKACVTNVLSPSSRDCPRTQEWENKYFPLALRSNFRLYDPSRSQKSRHLPINSEEDQKLPNVNRRESQKETPSASNGLGDMNAVEKSLLSSVPDALTFFQTKWDIQVQEYYERICHPEPAAPIDETVEALLEFHAAKPEEYRIRSRHRPDGSTNVGDDPQFWGEREPTRIMQGSMQSLWSRRTAMGRNSVPITYPH